MSLNQAINEHKTRGDNPDGSYTVTRTPARTYGADGRLAAAAAPTTFPIIASVQGATSEDLVDVPEGQSTTDSKVILTATELKPRSEEYEPDRITIKGRTYRIQSVEEVEHWGETHYECVAVKEDTL